MTSKYGLDIADWNATKSEMKQLLVERAKMRGMMTYGDLVSEVRAVRLEPNSAAVGPMLAEISQEEDAAGRGMLTVIVVSKNDDMQPRPGFFELAKLLGRDTTDVLKCWIDELRKVHGVLAK